MGRLLRIRLSALCVALCVTLLLPTASFGSAAEVIKDCNANNGLSRKYSSTDLQRALKTIPSDVAEYSDCTSIIKAAILAGSIRKNHKPRHGHRVALTASQQRKADKSLADVQRAVSKGVNTETVGTPVQRGQGRTLSSAATPSVPTPLLLALLGITLLAVVEFFGRGKRLAQNGNGKAV
ncbi:MAG: hypothetical protein JHC87_07195 [Thermoleophilaceae bacterium]|nr:hypothetical protein [Thermoleophilaceae bacterium]